MSAAVAIAASMIQIYKRGGEWPETLTAPAKFHAKLKRDFHGGRSEVKGGDKRENIKKRLFPNCPSCGWVSLTTNRRSLANHSRA